MAVHTQADRTTAGEHPANTLCGHAFEPAIDDPPDHEQRRRLARWAILAPAPAALLLSVHAFLTEPAEVGVSQGGRVWLLTLTSLFVPISIGSAYALARGASMSKVFGWFLVSAFCLIATICYLRGGIHSPTLQWLLVVTTGSMLAVGRRTGLVTIAGAAALILGFFLIDRTGLGYHGHLDASFAPVRWLPNLSAIAVLLYCEVALFERNKQRALNDLREANIELSAARDLADAANRSKSALLANVSHEIRSPMTAILGFTDLVHERSPFAAADPAARAELDTVRRSGTHLLEIINDILDLSKIEAGRFDLVPSQFSPTQLVADVVELMQVRAEAGGIELHSELSTTLPEAMIGDRKRIKQILINLVGNAIKFTSEGKVYVRAFVADPNSKPFVVFEVEDQGIGMSQEQLRHLFRPFSQADSSTTRTYGGTGLGLAICKRLAELMHGFIQVDSELGAGSTFRVALPAEMPAEPLLHLDQTPSPPAWFTAQAPAASAPDACRDESSERTANSHEALPTSPSTLGMDADPDAGEREEPGAWSFGWLRNLSIVRRWTQIREFFIPSELRDDPAELARARFITTFCLLPLPLIPAWALILPHLADAWIAPQLSTLIVLVTPLLVSVPLQLRRGGSIRAPVHVLLCYLWVMFGLLATVTTGQGSPAVAWMLVPPIVAVATLGLREGAIWLALCCVQLVAFQQLADIGVSLPNVVPKSNTALIGSMNLTSVIVLMGAFGALYQRTSSEAVESFSRTNRELATARDRANRANASKSEFIANISHELRTPMTAILGFTDVMLERWPKTPDEQQHVQSLETVRRNGLHLLEIINDILDLSKIEAGRVEIEREPLSPNELAREVFELMRIRAEEKEIDLRLEIAPDLPEWSLGDALRVRQVLINLLGNAIKFTETGSVGLEVSRERLDSKQFLQFSVCDTGIGISPDQLQNLFEPFSQADPSVAARYGGTGLGLAICKRLSELMGGRIRVRSTLGSGSVFIVQVPFSACDPPSDAARRHRSPRPQTAGTTPRPLASDRTAEHAAWQENPCQKPPRAAAETAPLDAHILLVDDSPDNQRLIAWILEKLGARITLADDGQSALDQVEALARAGSSFDLVLMDLQMPVLDGYAAIRKLRSLGHDIAVIALSAHAMAEARERALAAGADGYATKPIIKQELLPLIRQLLSDESRKRAQHAFGLASS